MKQKLQRWARLAAITAVGLGVAAARADGPDTSAITTAATNVGIVGAAVFAVYVAVRGFKWIRAAL